MLQNTNQLAIGFRLCVGATEQGRQACGCLVKSHSASAPLFNTHKAFSSSTLVLPLNYLIVPRFICQTSLHLNQGNFNLILVKLPYCPSFICPMLLHLSIREILILI